MTHKEYCCKHYGIILEYSQVIFETKSDFQTIKLLKSDEYGLVLIIDDYIQLIETKEFQYHEPITYYPLLASNNPKNILVIGGGDMGVVKYCLDFANVENIDFVELDQAVIDVAKDHLKSLYGSTFFDKRINLHIQDGRVFVAQKTNQYDVIIMDMTDPFGASKFLYTVEFFSYVKNALKNDGLFCMHSLSPDLRPDMFCAINNTLHQVFRHVSNAFNYVQMYGGLWSYAICGNADVSKIDKDLIAKRIKDNKLQPKILDVEGYFAHLHVPSYIKEILKRNKTLITDNVPLDIKD